MGAVRLPLVFDYKKTFFDIFPTSDYYPKAFFPYVYVYYGESLQYSEIAETGALWPP